MMSILQNSASSSSSAILMASSQMSSSPAASSSSSTHSIIHNLPMHQQQLSSAAAAASPLHHHHPFFRDLMGGDEETSSSSDDIDVISNGNEFIDNPYLICAWNWKDKESTITQNCVWRFPNATAIAAAAESSTTTTTTVTTDSPPSSTGSATKIDSRNPTSTSESTALFSSYEVTSTCIWENVDANSFVCDVSGVEMAGSGRYITYKAECDVNQMSKFNRNACKALEASIPTRDPTCQQCQWNLRRQRRTAKQPKQRVLEEDPSESLPEVTTHLRQNNNLRWLQQAEGPTVADDAGSDHNNTTYYECSEECWTATEVCEDVVFTKPENKRTIPDYHGLPWADSLVETMQWAVEYGESNQPIAFYDVQYGQPSLQAQDFAFGMTFHCPSGSYQGSDLMIVEDAQEGMRSGAYGILKGFIILCVGAAVLVFSLYRAGHCRKRPVRSNPGGRSGDEEGNDSEELRRRSKAMLQKGRSGGSGDALMISPSNSADSQDHLRPTRPSTPSPPSSPECVDSPPMIVHLPADYQQHQPPTSSLPPFPPNPHATNGDGGGHSHQPRTRSSSTPVLHSMTGDNMVLHDGIWSSSSGTATGAAAAAPLSSSSNRRILKSATSWQDEAEKENSRHRYDGVDHLLEDDHHHHHEPVMIVMDDSLSIPDTDDGDELSADGSTDFDDILQEVI